MLDACRGTVPQSNGIASPHKRRRSIDSRMNANTQSANIVEERQAV